MTSNNGKSIEDMVCELGERGLTIDELRSKLTATQAELAGANKVLAKLETALEWYGYKIVLDSLNSGHTEITTETGKTARQALAALAEYRKGKL